MDEHILEQLESLAAEYAVPGTEDSHFVLDQLDRYPGPLPFDAAPQSIEPPAPVEESIQLSPELVAQIISDLQRVRATSSPSADDPLEKLAAQLDAADVLISQPPQDSSQSLEPTDLLKEVPDSSEAANRVDTDEHVSQSDTYPPRQRRRRAVILVGLICAALIAGTSLVFLVDISKQKPGADSIKTQPVATADRQQTDTTVETAPPVVAPVQLSPDTTAKTEPSPLPPASTLVQSQRAKATPPSSPVAQPARTPQPTLPRKKDESDVTIVTPPLLPTPPPSGKFMLQVCATPSQTEAMRWKAFIDRQGSYSAVIVEYRMREQTYYRVRVGSFSSAEQAQRAAKELGLNPAAVWIVRIE
jgi:cell division protein FtsN